MKSFATPRSGRPTTVSGITAAPISSGRNPTDSTWVSAIFLRRFFGGSATGARQAPEKGATLQVNVNLTLEEAAFGCEKEVTVVRSEYCTECQGTRSKTGTSAGALLRLQRQRANQTGEIQRLWTFYQYHRLPEMPRRRPHHYRAVSQMPRYRSGKTSAHRAGESSRRRKQR